MSYDASIASAAGVATQATSTAAKKSGKLEQADFLKMLVAQMKFQNPMEPTDPSKFMEQMSQMTMIQGISDMQTTFKGLAESMSAGQAFQASSLIGRDVLVPGETGNLLPGGSIRGQVDLQESTTALRVSITDKSGRVVKVMELGSQKAGKADFSWDGKLDDGTKAAAGAYKVKVEAMTEGSMKVQEANLSATVESVNIDSKGVALNLQDGRQFGLKDIKEIF